MAYIVFVNPAILAAAGMPFDAVAVATALAAAIFTVIMGLTTNLPFALASGLGLNAYVAFTHHPRPRTSRGRSRWRAS